LRYSLANSTRERIVTQVALALEEQAALRDMHDAIVRITRIGTHVPGKRPRCRRGRQPPRAIGERSRRVDGIDRFEIRFEWRDAASLYRGIVHHARVEVDDLLRRRARPAVRRCRQLFDDGADVVVRFFDELGRGRVRHAIVRHRRGLEPVAVHISIEVVLGPYGAIEGGDVKP
jgi:hypothetical protein